MATTFTGIHTATTSFSFYKEIPQGWRGFAIRAARNFHSPGQQKHLHYLIAPTGVFAIFTAMNDGSSHIQYLLKDHQGSLAEVAGSEGQIEFHNQNLKVMSIKADNSVVFGNPDIACEVFINGELTTNQIRVNTGFWWDRVFSPDYALMPLNDLRDFITQNHHLPEIPPEAEVLESGIDLGEMNGLLLKKIEELTLYLLEQDSKINNLQTELQQIKNAGNNN